MMWRRALKRLKSARAMLMAAAAGLAALSAFGLFNWLAALLLFAVLCVTAAASGDGRRQTVVAARWEGRRTELSWQRALELPFDAIDDPACILYADGTVKFQNAAARTLFGAVAPDAHLSARIRSPAILRLVSEVTRSRLPAAIEHSERVPAERWFTVRCAPIDGTPVTAGGTALFVLVFRDMSEARRMDRMRSDFVANASHELRTPLASLTGFIETLRGPAKDDAAARERFLAIMHDQARRMTRLVADLMSLSRLELKAHTAPSERIDLTALTRSVADTLKPLAAEYEVEIETRVPDDAVIILGERDELIQVMENLTENACKYGSAGKKIVVALELLPSAAGTPLLAEFSVTDFGPGIASEHLPRLTERFYRVDVETSRTRNGTGLGLAIVKHILTRHRSRLLVRSRLGEGATFAARFEVIENGSNIEIPEKHEQLQ